MLIDRAFEEAGCQPVAAIELESVEAIKNAVRAGLGMALLGEGSVDKRDRRTGLVARPLAPALYREVALIGRAGRHQSPLVAQFAQVVAHAAASLGMLASPTVPRGGA